MSFLISFCSHQSIDVQVTEKELPLLYGNNEESVFRENDSLWFWNTYYDTLKRILPVEDLDYNCLEFTKEVRVVNSEKFVHYVDFSGNYGFLVFDSENIYLYEPNINLDILQNIDFFFDFVDYFVVLNNDNELFRLFDDNYEQMVEIDDQARYGSHYEGQLEGATGDGEIFDLEAYVADRYGDFYELEEMYYLHDYEWSNMFDTSVYIAGNTYNNDISSEGNCAINSAYSLLNNLPTLHTPSNQYYHYNQNFLYERNTIDYSLQIEDDPLYPSYGNTLTGSFDVDGETYFNYWRVNNLESSIYDGQPAIENMPELYMQLRAEAIEDHNYTPGFGMNGLQIPEMVQAIDGNYGYSLQFTKLASRSQVISNLNNGIPSIILTAGGETYGDPLEGHVMTIYGYAKYSSQEMNYNMTIPGLITTYHYFWVVDSGWGPSPGSPFYNNYLVDGNLVDWFDPGHSINGYITLKRTSLSWPQC